MLMNMRDKALLLKGLIAFAVILVVGLCVGTFMDLSVAQAIKSEGNPIAIVISTVGLFPLAAPVVVMLGALAQRSIASSRPPIARIGLAALCVALGCFTSYLAVKGFPELDGVRRLPFSNIPSTALLVAGVLLGLVLAFVGYSLAKKNDDAELVRNLLTAVVFLVVSFLVVEVIKNFMHRPRFNAIALGYEGVTFQPWYQPFSGYAELMTRYELPGDAFKSFPSGHSINAASVIGCFYGLAALIPSLRSKWRLALVLEFVVALSIMISRMVMGAHFLTDVSVGALVAVVASIILVMREKPSQES